MCGITGILGNADKAILQLMTDALSHRGPDDGGLYVEAEHHLGLGQRRLSIIDLSPSGHQPMSYAQKRYWIVYNGEVYNYQELRRELQTLGHSFLSQTDTEVVLAAYVQWGHSCLTRLRGMFAFAVWDRAEKTLFLARDRLGIKPLLYYQQDGLFLFASELKAILASGLVEPVINQQALFDYLAAGAVIQPKTMIQGVFQIDPGTSLTVRADGSLSTERYWDLVEVTASLRREYAQKPFSELVEITREKLEDACHSHLVADVPVGSFLSGGIDSTCITALMARYASYPINSFSVGFPQTAECQDELSYAKIAARHIGCHHTEIVLTGQDVARNFDHLIDSIDQPSQDGTNTFFVSRAASRMVKVTLSGLGGDELFAGYPHFIRLPLANQRKANLLDMALARMHRLRPNRFSLLSYNRCLSIDGQLAQLRRVFRDSEIMAILNPSLQKTFQPGFIETQIRPWLHEKLDALSQISLGECRGYLQNTLLRDNDVMSMAHSLEVRPVLLDHPFVEHAFALPPNAKIRNGVLKAALTESVQDLLPQETITRKKMGFEMPFGTWLQTDLRDRFLDCVTDQEAQSVFSPTFLKHCEIWLNDFRHTRKLWTFFIFWEWFRRNRCLLPN